MTKDVLVSITGAHVVGEDTDDVEVITAGNYYFKNGRHYVVYDETLDGVEGPIHNTIKIGSDIVDVIKNGSTRSHMVFEKNKKNVSCYVTPYGQMMVGINTDNIEVDEAADQLKVQVDYTLDVNYSELSKCRITMDIQSRATADIHLGNNGN